VAKWKHGNYVSEREQSTWFKIKNLHYSQAVGREEMFGAEIVGWESCALAVAVHLRKPAGKEHSRVRRNTELAG
jgi:hypothetical protein